MSTFGRVVTFVIMVSVLAFAARLVLQSDSPTAGNGASPTAATSATRTSDDSSIPALRTEKVFSNIRFIRPVFLTHAGDETDRLFVVEQIGRIKVLDHTPRVEDADVFLDIRSNVFAPPRGHNEEGLLALAFHPKYAENGYFYVYYSAQSPRRGVLSRFSVSTDDPNRADPDSEKVILSVEQPWGNHNGSTILFGPDGYLYISLGDGGSANDPRNSGQDLTTLLGAILRIDVDNDSDDKPYSIPQDNPFVGHESARPEIWAYGLRNVWRMSFDRETGDLWAGDVGQNAYEEIDLIVKGGNYGWNVREGMHRFAGRRVREEIDESQFIEPVVEYPRHARGEFLGMSVTGGYAYRGSEIDGLQGVYVYGDYATGRVWGLRHEDGHMTEHEQVIDTGQRLYITSFGESQAGELFICALDSIDGRRGATGSIYKIVSRWRN